MQVSVDQLHIVIYPEPVLRRKAKPIKAVTPEVQAVARKMIELMHAAPGVGLAGPQVGLGWRIFVANATGQPEDDRVFINPVLSEPTRALEDKEEGCLSLPNINAQVRRPLGVTVDALDIEGKPFRMTSTELEARIWQHETDHLDGILILDRMTPVDRMATQRVVRDLEEAYKEKR